jgi:imidazolonepropionase-like amidohydrolase
MIGSRESGVGNRERGGRGLRIVRHLWTGAVLGAALATLGGAAEAQTIAITGGKVYPVNGAPIENGTVLIRGGKIVAVGANLTIPADATRVDAAGKWVTPGLFNAFTELGVSEIGQVQATVDRSARGQNGIAASFPIWEGLNPSSPLIPAARSGGVTTVAIVPVGGLLAGQAAVIDLAAGAAPDLLVRAPAAMVADLRDARAAGTGSRGEMIAKLRELFDDVRTYARRKSDYERAQTRQFSARRADLEALIPVAEGKLPLLISADRASDIESALRFASDYKLRIILAGAAEGWQVAAKLAAAKVPVMVGAMNNIPTSFATLGTRQDNAALLRRAGVHLVLIGNGSGDEEGYNVRNIRFEAGEAVAYGLTWDDALRAITLAPAEALGVADRVGSLQPGRDADVVVWSDDPFEFRSRAEHVFVRGVEMPQDSRQDELMRRYRTLPPNYRRP